MRRKSVSCVGAVLIAVLLTGCGTSTADVDQDQRSYDAGYHSAGLGLVEQGIPATSACAQALQAAYLFVPADFKPYDTMAFNGGCYQSIKDNGDPVKNDSGDTVPGF